ncbi:Guanylate cyclase 32E [Bulinus truncatus]|nr:Guanylate cyclase 32E [Bulinus truncatus]
MGHCFRIATDFTSKRDNVTMDLWKCVFMLNNVPITNPNYAQWEDTVREYLYKPPINFTRKPLDALLNIKVQIPVFAAYLYDSVMLYARALQEVITQGKTPKDGAAVFSKLRERRFQSIQGHEVYLDMNGDAEANYTVLALRPMNNSYGRGLQPVGRFSRNSKNGQIVTYVMDVDVYGGDVPLDEPLCGYYGEWCREEASIVPAIIGGCLGGIGLILLIILTVSYRYMINLRNRNNYSLNTTTADKQNNSSGQTANNMAPIYIFHIFMFQLVTRHVAILEIS